MHITCEHCQATITIEDLAAFQRDGVTCPICGAFHFITAGRKTPFEPGSTTMMYSNGSTRESAKIVRRQRKP